MRVVKLPEPHKFSPGNIEGPHSGPLRRLDNFVKDRTDSNAVSLIAKLRVGYQKFLTTLLVAALKNAKLQE